MWSQASLDLYNILVRLAYEEKYEIEIPLENRSTILTPLRSFIRWRSAVARMNGGPEFIYYGWKIYGADDTSKYKNYKHLKWCVHTSQFPYAYRRLPPHEPCTNR